MEEGDFVTPKQTKTRKKSKNKNKNRDERAHSPISAPK
jgi:hypothetical protein